MWAREGKEAGVANAVACIMSSFLYSDFNIPLQHDSVVNDFTQIGFANNGGLYALITGKFDFRRSCRKKAFSGFNNFRGGCNTIGEVINFASNRHCLISQFCLDKTG